MSISIDSYLKRISAASTKQKKETAADASPKIDIEAGKAGYAQYLADVEAEKAQKKKAEESKSFWQKFVQNYNSAYNAQNTNNYSLAVDMYAKDKSYMRPSDSWTDEEKWTFGEKYAKNKDDAYAYAERVNNDIAKAKKEKQATSISEWSKKNLGTGLLASAGSVALNAFGGGVGFVDSMAQQQARGKIVEKDYLMPHEVSNTIQSSISSKLNEYGTINDSVAIFGGKGLGDVYGLGMSIGQSAFSAATGGSVGTLAQFFGMSASQGVTDALERGATAEQALAFGTISGLAEAIPEMISVKSLLGLSSAEATESVLRAVLKQAGEEAKEEFTTSVITEVADLWIMKGKSQYALTVQELIAAGMSPEEAENKAFAMTLENIAFDVISGAASGGLSGAGAVGVRNVKQRYFSGEANATAKEKLTLQQDSLIAEGKKYTETTKKAAALEKKLADGKELSGYELRMLASEVANAERASNVDTVRKAIVEKMKSEGVKESDAKRLGEIALNKALGNEVSRLQEGMLKRNAAAMKVYNQIDAENMRTGMTDSEWIENTPLQQLRNEAAASNEGGEVAPMQMHQDQQTMEATKPSLHARNAQNNYKINPESLEGKFAEPDGRIAYEKTSEDSKIHTEGISTSLTKDEIGDISALEKLANTLGVDIHVYESKLQKDGSRSYTDKDGNVITSSGFYDPNDKSIHIDLRAGDNGEGTMLYTASHELVHFMKDMSESHFDKLEKLVTEALVQGGSSIEKLIDVQRQKALANGQNLTEAELREEMVAEACQKFLASNTAVDEIKALKTKDKGLWSALKKFFTSLFNKINKIYKTVDPDSYEGRYIANMRNSAKRIRDAFMEGVAAAGEKYSAERKALGDNANVKVNADGEFVQGTTSDNRTIMTNANPTESKDIRHKARVSVDSYTEYDKPITAEDTAILRTIGDISVNEFTTTDIEKAQKWAYKFYKELGTKSPFFRAWFGDWRAFDQNTTKVINATRSTGKNPRGKFHNMDTGWEINSSSVGYDETVSHSGKNKKSIIAMQNIDKIIENAILLDTEVSKYGRGKKSVYTAFMHKFYALCRINGKLYIAKMAVDESYAPGQDNTNKKFYHVRAIEIETASSVGIGKSHTPIIEDTVSDISIADLFNFVKQYDDKFIPNAVNPLLLNEDGTPKIFYHGTNAEFSVFDADRTSRTTKRYAEGFYFTEERRVAEKWSSYREKEKGGEANVMAVYLDVKNPLIMSDKDYKSLGFDDKHRDKVLQSLIENKNDGIIIHPETERIPGIFEDSYKYEIDASVYTNAEKYGITDKDYAWWLEHSVSNPDFTAMQVAVFNSEQIKSSTDNIGTFNKGSTDIRYKARNTTPAETPYVSPTATSIVTNIPSGYTYTKKDKIQSGIIASKIAFTNAQAGIEDLAKKYGIEDMEALVQAARVATNQAEEMIGGDQYAIGSDTKDYLGEGLQKIIQPIKEMGEQMESAFYDYLFHHHNADRMSLERRSTEWLNEKKEDLKERTRKFSDLQKEQTSLIDEKEKLSRKKSDSARRSEINLRLTEIKKELAALGKSMRKLGKEIDEFTILPNKPVIGLNRDEVEAQKAELTNQISELREKKKALGMKKENASQVAEIKDQIAMLTKQLSELSAEVSEEQSREIISQYEKNYDFFPDVAEKIWKYSENLNKYRVDTGLIDQSHFDYLKKLYPHYVPTYRSDVKTGIAAVKGKNNLAISQTIRTATGSTKDLLNPIVIMARQTMETVRAGRINMIASRLYDGATAANDKTYLSEISRKKVAKSELVDLDPTELRPKGNQITFFKNGEKITLQASAEIFAGFDAFTPQFSIENPLVKVVTAVNNGFKKLVTSMNPGFLIRNSMRDIQDAGINSKYIKTFMKNYGRAASEIVKGGSYWKLYRAMGGSNVNYFDFDKGFKAVQSKMGFQEGLRYKIENANAFVECLPRLAEFISSLEAGNSAEQAMLDAADVTTNFARTGKITKALNSTVIPFLNSAIQGASKAVRNVMAVRSVKDFAVLAAKAVLVGIVPFALNSLLYSDDEDYEDLRETDKENNYLFKIGDKFIKLPRGRMASVLAGAYNQTVKSLLGEDSDWAGYLKNASTQMNPVENIARTIFSPFLDVINNVSWYGSAIEGREFENKSPAQRYDESTSSIAIAIGKLINYSPKKIHYILDQYSGVIGDFVLPATTKKAEKDFISGNFTIDPVTSNKLSDSFYDMYYEAQYAKSDDPSNKVAQYQVKHLNRVKKAISELYDKKSEIQNSNLSDNEKLAESRAVQVLINEIYKTALNDYDLITNAIIATEGVKDEYRYAEVQRLVYGAEEALKTYDDTVYSNSQILDKAGISYDNFYKYYFGIKDIESDKDKNGNTISGSKKKKVIKKINSLNISTEKKLLLQAYSGYKIDNESDKKKLINYLNKQSLTVDEKKALAKKLSLTYKNGKFS